MRSMKEADNIVTYMMRGHNPVVVLHCTEVIHGGRQDGVMRVSGGWLDM